MVSASQMFGSGSTGPAFGARRFFVHCAAKRGVATLGEAQFSIFPDAPRCVAGRGNARQSKVQSFPSAWHCAARRSEAKFNLFPPRGNAALGAAKRSKVQIFILEVNPCN
jgi:hypothetical protein